MQKENTTNKGGNLDQPNVTKSLALAGLFEFVKYCKYYSFKEPDEKTVKGYIIWKSLGMSLK